MNLKHHKKQQSIIITGVSGSGKTETTKHIIDFLCENSSQSADAIFEDFGNAKTRANNNSSRFCKQILVQ